MNLTKTTSIELTKFFNANKYEPGQPGVFEVDGRVVDDSGLTVQRYSYFNGKDFGPVLLTPAHAYAARFDRRGTEVTVFRGLVEQA